MKVLFYGLVLVCLHAQLSAQMPSPVSWSFTAEHVSDDEVNLHFKAEIDGDWNIYSQFIDEGGPVPTSFDFEEADHFTKIGKAEERGNKKEGFDTIFEMQVIKFSKSVDFVQQVKVKDFDKSINGQVEFMVCNEESCLPPKRVDFSIPLK